MCEKFVRRSEINHKHILPRLRRYVTLARAYVNTPKLVTRAIHTLQALGYTIYDVLSGRILPEGLALACEFYKPH